MARPPIVTIHQRNKKMLDFLGNPPLLTVLVGVTCIIIFATQIGNIGAVCLSPARVVSRLQLYRIVTFPYFHGGFIHIFFNMLAWLFLGKEFERIMGTLGAAYSVFILFIPLSAILHCLAAFLLDALASTQFRNECAIGISGVLFSILVYNLQMSTSPSVSFFGLFNIPSLWYPWILAFLLQLFSSRLSLLGHLSGIVLGYALSYGWLEMIAPSEFKLRAIEENVGLTRWPLWQSVPSFMGVMFGAGSGLPQSSDSGASFGERCQAAWQGVKSWFALHTSGSTSNHPFSGTGRALGGGSPRTPTGRVPASSRLLQNTNTPQPTSEEGGSSAEKHGDSKTQANDTSEDIPTEAPEAPEAPTT